MKIAFLGNFAPWWSTETDLAYALRKLGHDVLQIQENQVNGEQAAQQTIDFGADVFLWVRTWTIDSGHAMLDRIRAAGIPSVGYTLDLWHGVHREDQIEKLAWFRCDLFVSADGAHEAEWKAAGVNHLWAPPAVSERWCYLGEPDPGAYPEPIIFVGSRGYHPEHPRTVLVDWLASTYGDRFKLYDHSWKYDGDQNQPMRGDRLNRLYASARVVVGDSCFAGRIPNYTSDRLFETLGRGGFLLYPHIDGVTDGSLVEAGKHLVTFPAGGLDRLRALIDEYSERSEECRRIQVAGMEHVRSNHTYRHRMEWLLGCLRERGMIR